MQLMQPKIKTSTHHVSHKKMQIGQALALKALLLLLWTLWCKKSQRCVPSSSGTNAKKLWRMAAYENWDGKTEYFPIHFCTDKGKQEVDARRKLLCGVHRPPPTWFEKNTIVRCLVVSVTLKWSSLVVGLVPFWSDWPPSCAISLNCIGKGPHRQSHSTGASGGDSDSGSSTPGRFLHLKPRRFHCILTI
jgi:hypothetical protein